MSSFLFLILFIINIFVGVMLSTIHYI